MQHRLIRKVSTSLIHGNDKGHKTAAAAAAAAPAAVTTYEQVYTPPSHSECSPFTTTPPRKSEAENGGEGSDA